MPLDKAWSACVTHVVGSKQKGIVQRSYSLALREMLGGGNGMGVPMAPDGRDIHV